MAHRADNSRQDIEDTRHDIEDTRSAMTEKLELLGERVQETVEGVQASVEGLVENVKDTVDMTVATLKRTIEGAQASVERVVENVKGTVTDTVTTVKHTFDVPYQVEQRPWLMVGGATLVGYLLGSRRGSRPSAAFSTPDPPASTAATTAAMPATYTRPGSSPSLSSEPSAHPPPPQGIVSGALDQLKDEIATIKGVAVGAVMNILWGMVKQALLPAAPHSTNALTKQSSQPGENPAQQPASLSRLAVNGGVIVCAGPVRQRQHAQPGERGVC